MKKPKGHSKKKRHSGVGVPVRGIGISKEVTKRRRGKAPPKQVKYVTLVTGKGKAKTVREDSL